MQGLISAQISERIAAVGVLEIFVVKCSRIGRIDAAVNVVDGNSVFVCPAFIAFGKDAAEIVRGKIHSLLFKDFKEIKNLQIKIVVRRKVVREHVFKAVFEEIFVVFLLEADNPACTFADPSAHDFVVIL